MDNLQIRKMLLPESKYNIKSPYTMKPEIIVIHNTWNTAPAKSEIAYMNSNNLQLSFHWAVDEKEAVQGLPLNRNGWHAGDGANGRGNRKGIGIEICRSRSDINLFKKAERNGAKLTAMHLKQYGWGIDRVCKHEDFMDKYCPHRTLDLGWDRFLKMVEEELKRLNTGKYGKFYPNTRCDVYTKPNKLSKSVGAFITKPFNIDDIIFGEKYLWAVTHDTGYKRYVSIADVNKWNGNIK